MFGPYINAALAAYGIDTLQRIAAWLAQVGHECGGLRWMREIWGPTAAQQRYEGRADLGNTQPGDGRRYLGRGLIQLTGRANYRAFTQRMRARYGPDAPDFEARPELLEEPRWAVEAACDYWASRGLNELADRGEFEQITRRINGGLNGHADRVRRWERAKAVLTIPSDHQASEDAMPPFIAAALPAVINAAPALIDLFKGKSEVAQRNAEAAKVVVDIAKTAVGAVNEQDLVQKLEQDPEAPKIVRRAIEDRWFEITEAGGGGIAGAREANKDQPPPARNMALWVTAALLPLVYLTAGAVLFGPNFSDDMRSFVVGAVMTGTLGAIVAFWLGSSWGSQRKDELRAQQ
ncbi:MAG: hypothetical protein N2483_06920 [Burkholderiaceae bacterium]|nr:hypothetical protein [Burkholderiaceae bacterium]